MDQDCDRALREDADEENQDGKALQGEMEQPFESRVEQVSKAFFPIFCNKNNSIRCFSEILNLD